MILLELMCAAWFVLAFVAAIGWQRSSDHHAAEREMWRAERQLLQARVLKPVPSSRRPSPAVSEKKDKLTELRRIAAARPTALDTPEEPRVHIIPTDL